MSTTLQQFGDGIPYIRAPELNTTNIARDYLDQSTAYHNTNVTIKSGSRVEPFDLNLTKSKGLLEHVAHGAVHDSAERGPDAPKCHPETRVAVQKDIMSWINHGERDDTPKRILWLSGPAGSGKTAIAGTIADECYKKGMLAASFFFSAFAGTKNRRWKKPFIPTLVYGLLQYDSIIGYKDEVLTVIERDPMVFEKHLDQQLEKLILEPLRKALGRSDFREWPKIILVDGLDECQGNGEPDVGPGIGDPTAGSNAQKEILSALSRACADPAFPFSIIIASRPEPVIRHFFFASPCPALNIFLDHKYNPDADIRLFLQAMFSDLRRRFNLSSDWASEDVVDLLVREASGQFIYATTVIRFVNSHRQGPPQKQLSRLMEWRRLDDAKAFAPLDALYSRILRTSPDPLLAVRWLWFIEQQNAIAWYCTGLLESYDGETEHVLGTLTSLVGLVHYEVDPFFVFYHKSLFDFLRDPHRSSDLHICKDTLIHFTKDRYYQTLQYCRRRYTAEDVEWWLATIRPAVNTHEAQRMISSVHQKCKWYHCLPACGVWRKGILRHCREHGWRVPTVRETLLDRFKKFEYDPLSLKEFPLRPKKFASALSKAHSGTTL
ncbi:hypothetical protein FA13DRAFT_1719096 [Coprinellus micaceus]|uniref:NACHT domain-containing protein n=1 Tax=Coprinellus micaceus TaxID=71717 RepID=A0A4Y7SCQ6_COPMI|nr:hypothetical protein FA13DRAFT_1719096 [Coprinellus micaceus]